MPRARQQSKEQNTTNNERNSTMAASDMFVDVEDNDLDAILAGARERGKYDVGLIAFLDSGKRGVEVSLESGPFAGKKPVSVKTGFDGALTRLKEGKLQGAEDSHKEVAEAIGVTSRNDRVFLIRRDIQAAAA